VRIMRILLAAAALLAGCQCSPAPGADDGGQGGGSAGGSSPPETLPVRGSQTSIALDPEERPQILLRASGPLLAKWSGSRWDVTDLAQDAGFLAGELTLSIDGQGHAHMSWTRAPGNVEYAVLDETGLHRFLVFRSKVGVFGGQTSSPRDPRGLPYIGYVQVGGTPQLGTHLAHLNDAGEVEDAYLDCCATGVVAVAVRSDGVPLVAYQHLPEDEIRLATPLADGGFASEVVGNSAGSTLSLALDALDRPQLVFQSGQALTWAARDGGAWQSEEVEPALSGDMASLALAADGSPRIVSLGRDGGQLLFGRRSSAGWQVDVIGPRALWPSIAVGSNGTSHIAYADVPDGGVHYLTVP
jgi:hypothetical protein